MKLPTRPAEYELRVAIKGVDGETLENLKCLVYLPAKTIDQPQLFILLPTQNRIPFGTSNGFWKFSLTGEIVVRDEPYVSISSDTVYLRRVGQNRWAEGDGWNSIWHAIPADLRVREIIDYGLKETHCNFWIMPSFVLTPAPAMSSITETGNVKMEPMEEKKFSLKNGLSLDFKTHFRSRKLNGGDRRTSFLVAESNIWNYPDGSDQLSVEILKRIDDFLLIAALAAREPCICTGWEAYDQNGKTRYYRGDIVIPKIKKRIGRDDLISLEHQNRFVLEVYPRFADDPSIDLIRRVVHGLLARKSIMEDTFLRLFSCLETLVLAFRRENGLEYIFPTNAELKSWRKFRNNDLKEWLEQQPMFEGEGNSQRRLWLSDNLPALDRITFSYAFQRFCEHYKVELSDLWPVADSLSSQWSLKKVRDKLAHGDVLGAHKHKALGVAMEHLQCIVERMLLSYFGWDVTLSHVSAASITQHGSVALRRDWELYRKQMSDAS